VISDCVKSVVTLSEDFVVEELEEPSRIEDTLNRFDENVSKVAEVVDGACD
jgi:hypothetical protein